MNSIIHGQKIRHVDHMLPTVLVDAIDAYRARLLVSKSRSKVIAEFCIEGLKKRGIRVRMYEKPA